MVTQRSDLRSSASLTALGLALCLPRPAQAVELLGTGPLAGATVQFNDDFELRYLTTDRKLEGFEDRRIHDYVEEVNRLNMLLAQRLDDGRNLAVGVQLDQVALFSNRYVLDGVEYQSWDLLEPSVLSPWDDALIQLEKLYLTTGWRTGSLSVGDTYGSFGRGIALNIKKNTDIDIDTSVRGARGIFRFGPHELTLISGLSNRQQISQDQPNLGIFKDVPHMISGAELVRYGLGSADVGVHGVIYRFGRETEADLDPFIRYAEPLDAAVAGANVDIYGLAGVDWALEADLFNYLSPDMLALTGEDAADFSGQLGHALYLSASAYPGDAVVLVEAKKSKDTERINTFVYADGWEVATGPSLEYERVITEDSSAAVNSNDVYGGRVRVDYTLGDGRFIPYLSVLGLRDRDEGGLHFNQSPETIGHALGGIAVAGTEVTGALNTGVRVDVRDDPAEGRDRMIHLDGDIAVPVGPKDHIELSVDVKHFSWGENIQGQEDYLEMANAIVWKRGEKLLFTLYQDWSDNPLVTSVGNLGQDLYGAAEITWKPGPNASLRAFFGAYKAGIRCSGGQCRTLPGFEGGRLAYTGSF